VAGTLPAGTSLGSIAGNYALTLVATSGPRAGQSVSGMLSLDSPVGSTAGTSSIHGSASIALDKVGATAPGAGTEVEAIQWESTRNGVATREMVIRIGTIVPPSNTRVIEGAHMALFVGSVDANGMAGRWDSGSGEMRDPAASGRFCASRTDGR
jgi:hypothetical protein